MMKAMDVKYTGKFHNLMFITCRFQSLTHNISMDIYFYWRELFTQLLTNVFVQENDVKAFVFLRCGLTM